MQEGLFSGYNKDEQKQGGPNGETNQWEAKQAPVEEKSNPGNPGNPGENPTDESAGQAPLEGLGVSPPPAEPKKEDITQEPEEEPEVSNKGAIIAVIVILIIAGAIYAWQKRGALPELPDLSLPGTSPETGEEMDKGEEEKGGDEQIQPQSGLEEEGISYNVYFSKSGEDCGQVFPVERKRQEGDEPISTGLMYLFAGPTELEKQEGYSSFFSDETFYILHWVKISKNVAYVNLNDIREIIPSASSSCGSEQLLAQIESTIKQFIPVEKVIIAINSNPAPFYEWIQRECPDDCDMEAFKNAGVLKKEDTSDDEPTSADPSAGEAGATADDDKICVDECGDDVCQEIVCLGTGCPCAETPATCSMDCK